MKKTLLRTALFAVALVAALGVGELVARQLPEHRYEMFYADEAHERFEPAEAERRGYVLRGELPRGRALWAPSKTFYICYVGGSRPYMDAHGCARVDINSFSLRDREDLTVDKPPGQKRIVCLGDSFTFGWGVAVERTWPRLLEPRLAHLGNVRTVNCGASGTLLVDEYWWGLRDRFGRFDPDVVLVTICLNDLVPMPSVIGLYTDQTYHGCDEHDWLVRWDCEECVACVRDRVDDGGGLLGSSRLWQLLTRSGGMRERLALDPEVDWGRWLLELPEDWPAPLDLAQGRSHYELQGTPPEATWKHGGPQQALRAMRAWCAERGVALGVVVWPLFQGLEDDAVYPFTTLHDVVREFCAAEGIACLDLLSSFRGHDSLALWVDPSDAHANEIAHEISVKPIADFTERVWPKDD